MGKRKNKNNSCITTSRPSDSSSVQDQSRTRQTNKSEIPYHLLAAPNEDANTTTRKHLKCGKIQCLSPGTVWVQTNFLSPLECQEWIAWSDTQWEYTTQRATRHMAHRECYRIQRNDERVAQALFDRLQQSGLLARVERDLSYPYADYRPVAGNPNIRLYQYGKSMSFGKHIDGSNETAVGQTEITLLVYLSECQGGATRFYRDSKNSFAFAPQVGAVLLHVHGDRCLEHEADPVLSGTKYVLRSDVCYRRIS